MRIDGHWKRTRHSWCASLGLLAVPPFTPATARALERLRIGIPGLPLLP